MRLTYHLAICLVLGWSIPARAETVSCTIDSLHGASVSVVRGGTVSAASLGSALSGRDRIETGAGARAVIVCSDGIRITVGPASVLDLNETMGASQGWSATLFEGIAGFARSLFGAGRFEVRTPSAVASVRSTEWTVEVDAGATAVFVESGRVAVATSAGSAALDPGEGIDIAADGSAGPVKRWGEARIRRMKERLGLTGE